MKRMFAGMVAVVALLMMGWVRPAVAQDSGNAAHPFAKNEVFADLNGIFTKDTTANNLLQQATNSAGFSAGYRYHFNDWNAVEARYGYTRNGQRYFASGNASPSSVQSDAHEVSFAYVLTVPHFGRLVPYVLGGGGLLYFNPTTNAVSGAQGQTKGTFVYGGGVDLNLLSNFALRAEYRGLIYKVPDYQLSSLATNSWSHIAEPTIGLVFRF